MPFIIKDGQQVRPWHGQAVPMYCPAALVWPRQLPARCNLPAAVSCCPGQPPCLACQPPALPCSSACPPLSTLCSPQVRFCQQCGRFQPLGEFDGEKRSCRVRLQVRTPARRRCLLVGRCWLALCLQTCRVASTG